MNIANILTVINANLSYARPLEIGFAEYQLSNSINQIAFISQYAIKSDNFYFSEESFNRIDKLMQTFKSINTNKAMQLCNKNNKSIKLYLKKYGTEKENERFKYRERGILKLIGKVNYNFYGDLLGIDLISCPSNAKRDYIGVRIALEYWFRNNCENKINNMEELTKIIQGNTNDIEKVKSLLKLLKVY